MTGAFSTEVLSEKLSKLNASQQSIESLSHWCIHHRKRAKHIVKTWEKEFFVAPKERRVSFLYLANDIIQNSRKKGSEFVTEFWKVLNNALKDVKANGDESGRNAVTRLVGIWEERKVFGSRVQSLREELLGNNPLPDLENHEKEKPAPSSIKIKLDGSILEKVAKAYKEVNDGLSKEEATIEECNSTRRKIEALEKEATSHVGGARENGTSIADELQQQQGGLFQSIEQLRAHENTRSKLVTHLREALIEQERKLEHIRSQIQIAQSQAEQVGNFAQHLLHGTIGSATAALNIGGSFMEHRRDVNGAVQNMAPIDDGNKKPKDAAATAAEVAAKLAASSSPAAMLSSVLSSLTAEESAALGFHSQDVAHQDKRQRLDGVPEGLTYTDAQQYLISPVQHQAGFPQTSVLQQSQFIGASMGMPYAYSGVVPPPPPPLQGRPQIHVSMPQPPQQLPQAPQQLPQAPQQLPQQIPQPPQQIPQPSPQQMAQLAQQMPQIPQQLPQPPPLPPGCTPGTYHSLPPSMSYYPTAPAPVPR